MTDTTAVSNNAAAADTAQTTGVAQAAAPAPNAVDAVEAAIEKVVADVTAERDALKQKVAELESKVAGVQAVNDQIIAAADVAVATAKAEGEQALADLKERMKPALAASVAERDALKAKLAELTTKIEDGTATATDGVARTFEDAKDEAAYLKDQIVKAIDGAKGYAARLADIVPHPAIRPAMAFHAAVAGLKSLADQLL
jgi:phage shock protein A